MSADALLDLAGIILVMAFIVLMIAHLSAAIFLGDRATLRDLTRSVRLTTAAAVAGVANLVVQTASIPYDGIVWPLLWVLNTAIACTVTVSARRRRSAKGDQVLAEAERTVRDFNPLGDERDADR